jgi:hypothetical protein
VHARAWILLAALASTGCRVVAEPTPTVAPEPATELASERVSELEPRLRVAIHPQLEPTKLVEVRVELSGPALPDPLAREWSLAGPLVQPFSVAITDAEGELAHTLEATETGGVKVVLARAPSLPVRFDYTLAPVPARLGEVARIELDEAHLFATGEALLLLPDALLDQRRELVLELDPEVFTLADPSATAFSTATPPIRAATSFVAEPLTRVDGWPFELRRAAFIMGPVEWAQFDSAGGDDRWLGVGSSRFDQRWPAAEIAGVRSAIDAKIGMQTIEPMVTMLVAGPHSAAEPAFFAELRGRGLVILADHSAVWDATARMTATQALLARWLGGRVRVLTQPDAEHPQATELWFTAGVTRFFARETLYELGLLSDEEYLAEVNHVELELASSTMRAKTLPELAALAAADVHADPSVALAAAAARAALIARGSAFAASLDAQSRRDVHYSSGLSESVRMLIAGAIVDGRRELPLTELLERVAERISYEAPPYAQLLAEFNAVVGNGQRPELLADSYGPCFTPRKHKLQRFELGFVDTTRLGDERPSFLGLDPEGPAAQAGLRADDELHSLDYVAGDPRERVRIGVVRGEAFQVIEYQPAGPKLQVVQWHRLANVPPEECVRG